MWSTLIVSVGYAAMAALSIAQWSPADAALSAVLLVGAFHYARMFVLERLAERSRQWAMDKLRREYGWDGR